MGVLCCALPYHLYTTGLKEAEAGPAAILATIEPFVAAGLGILLFQEAVTPLEAAGDGSHSGAVLLLNTSQKLI